MQQLDSALKFLRHPFWRLILAVVGGFSILATIWEPHRTDLQIAATTWVLVVLLEEFVWTLREILETHETTRTDDYEAGDVR